MSEPTDPEAPSMIPQVISARTRAERKARSLARASSRVGRSARMRTRLWRLERRARRLVETTVAIETGGYAVVRDVPEADERQAHYRGHVLRCAMADVRSAEAGGPGSSEEFAVVVQRWGVRVAERAGITTEVARQCECGGGLYLSGVESMCERCVEGFHRGSQFTAPTTHSPRITCNHCGHPSAPKTTGHISAALGVWRCPNCATTLR